MKVERAQIVTTEDARPQEVKRRWLRPKPYQRGTRIFAFSKKFVWGRRSGSSLGDFVLHWQ